MAVSLSKEECIKKIDLRKNTLVNLTKDDPVLKNLKSRVAVVLDFSGSMSSFYRNGKVQELLEKLIDLIDYLVPLYLKEGKSSLVIAIGCTGGKHRSVTFAEEIHKHCLSKNLNSSINHRDITK